MFNSFIYLYLGFVIVKYAKTIPTIADNKLCIIALNILIVIAAVSHLLINLSLNLDSTSQVSGAFVFMFETSVNYVFFIIFFRTIRYLFETNRDSLGFMKIPLNSIYPTMYYLYIGLISALLWIIVITKLNSNYFVGILSVLIAITLSLLMKSYLAPIFQTKYDDGRVSFSPDHGLSGSLQTLIILGGGWAFYNIGLKYFDLGSLVGYVSNKHIIVTDLVKISHFSFITDAFTFLLLFALIGLLKNLHSFYESNKTINRFENSSL